MSNYIKTTNFAAKDSLPSGNPAKIVKGTEINTEFDNIAVASATKLNSSTVSTFGATLIDDANASAARTTLGLGTAATTASTDYATAAQGTTADAALPKTGGAMTGAITTNSTFDGVDVAVRDGVLTSTTTTANAALPKAGGAMTGAITTNSTFDGRDVATDGTKLDGIEASADVTDTTNVVAALSTGTGISLSAGGEIGNTAPDQTVALTGGGGTTISGTYPSFTITSSSFALPTATATALGGIELFSDTDQTVAANAVTTTAARTYGIQLNSDDQAVINVPWTDTTYTVGDGGLTEINFTSADNTKLDGIEASADVTDTTNVVASLTAGSNITIAADGTIASTASGGGETLAQTLALGNTTGGTDLVVSTGDSITLPDGAKIKLGDEPNLEISHSGTHSIIEDVGGGSLFIKGGPQLKLFNDGESAVLCQKDAGVTLYHNNIAKVVTTATGLSVTGTTVTDAITIAGAITENAVTLTGTSTTIDLTVATNFVHDLTGATTYTFSNPAVTGNASSFTLKIIQDSTARTITWPASVDWAGGTAPTISTANNAVDIFTFYTIDGGTAYYGFTAGQAMA